MMNIFLLCVLVSVTVIGCSPRYPVTRVEAADSRPTLAFTNVSPGQILFIDGVNSGDPSLYDGRPKVLRVEPGTHEVVISSNNQNIFQQTIFVESEHKTINVR